MFRFRKRIRKARYLDKENAHGNIEYKLKLCNFKHENRMTKLSSQMKFRLYEGEGYAIYNIGYLDSGEPNGISYEMMMDSLNNIHLISNDIEATIKSIKIFQGLNGYCSNIFLEKNMGKMMMNHHDLSNSLEILKD
jgi:GTPase